MNDAALAARRMWALFEPVHVISYFAADVDDCESVVLRVAVDLATGGRGHVSASVSRERIQPARGWTDAEWTAATARLTERGLPKDSGEHTSPATEEGLALHRSIEEATDRAAARPWARLGSERITGLASLLAPSALPALPRFRSPTQSACLPRPSAESEPVPSSLGDVADDDPAAARARRSR
ncbi:MAG: helix-turn-helix domain-containing protein [Streptosporangiaceae bacterium]